MDDMSEEQEAEYWNTHSPLDLTPDPEAHKLGVIRYEDPLIRIGDCHSTRFGECKRNLGVLNPLIDKYLAWRIARVYGDKIRWGPWLK